MTAPPIRALAPDLARGAMLALIAVAHAQVLAGSFASGARPQAVPDVITQALVTLLVDSRGYPMFAALFGYGMVQILRRREVEGGWPFARGLLRRRGAWMIAFGAAHVLLLYPGDILASYGLLALLLVGALRWSDRTLLTVAGALGAAGALAYGALLAFAPTDEAGFALLVDPLTSAVYRFAVFPVIVPLNALMAAGPVLIGIWAGRRRLLERPAEHATLLRRVTSAGIAVAVLGGLPEALVTTGLWHPAPVGAFAAASLHTFAGFGGGFGYAALIGLAAARLAAAGRDGGWLVRALSACGQRSMTCYLAQSVAWFVLLEPYVLGLGGRMGVLAATAVGLGIWALTVVGADLLGRRGLPGPAEALLRRLTYGRRRDVQPAG